ncbi:MAG TPA: TonB-dependent receptor [Gemmatimonadaceae bacterium]|nr:TonB-dependent receptor [Gemmatimonadaceae bacterium]
MRAPITAFLAVLTSPLALLAQQTDTATRTDSAGRALERVVVSATKTWTSVGGAGAVIVAIDSMRLTPSPMLAEALREMPFVLVRQNSRGEAELSVRGSDSRQAAVLMDGFPLTLGFDHRSDPSILPLSGVRSIVLVRGLSSLLHGPNVLGGVLELGINHVPIADSEERSLELHTGFDQVGGHAHHIAAGLPASVGNGRLLVRAGAGYRDRPGVRLSSDVLDTSSQRRRRTNSDVRQLDGFIAARYQSAGGRWIGFSASGYQAERGVPPELHVAEPRLWRYPDSHRLLAILSAGTGRVRTPLGSADAEIVLGVNDGRNEIESFASTEYDDVVGTELGEDRTFTARLLADHSLGMGELRTSATFADVRNTETVDTDPSGRYRQRLWSVAAEVEQPIAGYLRASGGVALDGASTPESADKPPLGDLDAWGARLGLSSLAFGGTTRLHASVSRRARFPALRELYSGALGRFEPNPNLKPERLLGAEVGATMLRSRLQLQGVVFHHRLNDAVVRVSTETGNFRRVNRHQIRSTGLELLGGRAWDNGASISADLLVQRVRVIDPALSGEQRAEHQPELRGGVEASVPLPLGLRGLASAQYIGRQYCVHPDRDEQLSLAGKARADVGVEREFNRGGASGGLLRRLRASVLLDNVTDAAVFDQCGLPQPGRTVRVGISWR